MTTKKNVKEQTALMESKYSIDELVAESTKAFGTSRIIVKAALKVAGKNYYTEKEAVKIVERFRKKEVK